MHFDRFVNFDTEVDNFTPCYWNIVGCSNKSSLTFISEHQFREYIGTSNATAIVPPSQKPYPIV